MTPIEFRKERNKLERAVKSKIAPFLYKSGFVREALSADRAMLLLWVPKTMAGELTNKVYSLKGGFVIQEFEGFTEQGVITDGEGGALVTTYWEGIPIEDLYRLSLWMDRMLPKLTKYDQSRKLTKAPRQTASKSAVASAQSVSTGS